MNWYDDDLPDYLIKPPPPPRGKNGGIPACIAEMRRKNLLRVWMMKRDYKWAKKHAKKYKVNPCSVMEHLL